MRRRTKPPVDDEQINPRRGFLLRSSIEVWGLLVLYPFVAGIVIGSLVGIVPIAAGWIAFVAAAVTMIAAALLYAEYLWLDRRGWAAAISDFEHRRRKAQTWGRKATDA